MARPRFADGGTASEYGGWLRIYSRGQPTRGGPPAWGLGEVLTTLHRKKLPCYETLYRASDLDRWRALMSAVMNLQVPQNAGNFLTS
jgi:hypothetical protein